LKLVIRPLVIFLVGLALASCHANPAPQTTLAQSTGTIESRIADLIPLLDSPGNRKKAREDLTALGKDATPVVLKQMNHSSSTVRWELANFLGTIADERGLPALAHNVTADSNHHVRWRSIWALAMLRKTDQVLAALEPALKSTDTTTRWNAAVALSMFGSTAGLPLLHAGVRDPDPFRRWEALNALGRVNDLTTVSVLAPALGSPSVRDRSEAVLSLGYIGSSDALQLLIKALRDPDADVRWRAAMMIGRVGDSQALPALRDLLATETDSGVLKQANNAIAALEQAAR
jgi:HEAT repeat protein